MKVIKNVDDLQSQWSYLLVKPTGAAVVGEWSPKYGQFIVGELYDGFDFEDFSQVWELGYDE